MLLAFRWIGLLAVMILLFLMIGPFQGLEHATGVSDKLCHAAAFGLATAVALASMPSISRLQVAGLVFCLGLGVELVQGMTGRDADVFDGLADMVGISVVVAVWLRRRWV